MSDNAADLCQGLMKELFFSQEIFHQTSYNHTPEQNEVLERKHGSLLEMTRALPFQSNIPQQYWNESILCATYLINTLPTKYPESYSLLLIDL